MYQSKLLNIILFAVLLFLIGCSTEIEYKILPKEAATEKPERVKLYMETSASMKGYAIGSVDQVISHLRKRYPTSFQILTNTKTLIIQVNVNADSVYFSSRLT